MLALLDYSNDDSWVRQRNLMFDLIVGIRERRNTSQWMAAIVPDFFTANNLTVDVSHFSFKTLSKVRYHYLPWDPVTAETQTNDIGTVLKYKIEFVKRLFNEITGIRNTSSRVGVVFLDCDKYTHQEIINVSSIIQREQTDVKFLVVISGCKHVQGVVHMPDVIVLPDITQYKFASYLHFAVCNLCPPNWTSFEHTVGLTGTSCYFIGTSRDATWASGMSYCSQDHHGNLAAINTDEELQFLRNFVYRFMETKNLGSIHVNIGLQRDTSNYAKRFQWVTITRNYGPLLISHWLEGKPSMGCIDTNCGVWWFTTQHTHDPNESSFHDGWDNTNCFSKVTPFSLCEIFIPQRTNAQQLIQVTKVSNETFKSALNKGNFVEFQENIVSMSENVANKKFVQFLKDSNIDFPIFDCGKDAGHPRYISYSKVCDFVDHCSNRRDEVLCFNPRELTHSVNYCLSGQHLLSFQSKCDNVRDCADGSDEVNCIGHPCNSVRCIDGSCLPPQWVNDGVIDCLIWNDNVYVNVTDENLSEVSHYGRCSLTCNNGNCIKKYLLNNSAEDCIGSERPLDQTTEKLEQANICEHESGIIWGPKCTYIKDRYGGIIGCRDMSHVRDCENYTCIQGYVKCHNSYCIPQHYLLDGKEDCPTGEDEQPLYIGPCIGHFACRDSKVCLHPDRICDGHPDCPHDDDELDCQLVCPKGFRCVAGTVTVSDYNKSFPLDMSQLSSVKRRTRYLDISGVAFSWYSTSLKYLLLTNFQIITDPNLKVLIMSNCNISTLDDPLPYLFTYNNENFSFMLEKLDISHNMFKEIFSDIRYTYIYKYIKYLNVSYNTQLKSIKYFRFNFLEILDLSYTGLVNLNDSVFVGLPELQHLNLSHTLISDFSGRYFPRQLTLQTLDLRGIPTDDFRNYSFHGLTISHTLYTDHFQICCPQILALHIELRVCVSPGNEDLISSCFHLLELKVQRVLLWILAVLAVLGNITVIVFRIIWDRSVLKTGYGLFVTNLGIADFIMGVYLFIIAGADYFYRDNYVLFDKTWRKGLVCKFAGFMATLSCEASTLFVFLITLERFLVMKFPFGNVKCSMYIKIIAVVLSWLESIVLSLLPIVLNLDIYSSNAMCLGLPLKNKVNGWEYSVGVFLIHNFVLFLLIAYGQYATFRAMSDNRVSKTAAGMSRTRRVQEITVAKQLSLVVISNFLFWFPVGLIGLMSLIGYEVSDEAYAWITVILLPINSAANPVLYTIPAVMARWKQFKHGVQTTQ